MFALKSTDKRGTATVVVSVQLSEIGSSLHSYSMSKHLVTGCNLLRETSHFLNIGSIFEGGDVSSACEKQDSNQRTPLGVFEYQRYTPVSKLSRPLFCITFSFVTV